MSDYHNKKIAILGLGIEGVDVAKYLVSQGAQITLLDRKPANDLSPYLDQISHLSFSSRFGNEYLEDLNKYDFIFRSPGVKILTPELISAKSQGVKITSATKEFFARCPGKIIGVTGTKGKGTTAALITYILKTSNIPVYLAGNIGNPMLSLLDQLNSDDWIVLELSSFQLQDLTQSPHIAVVTNITSDHLDYHRNRSEYTESKFNLFKFQTPKDFAVLNSDDPTSMDLAKKISAQKYFYSLSPQSLNGTFISDNKFIFQNGQNMVEIGNVNMLKLRGRHNWSNAAAAVTASCLAGAAINSIKQAISSFSGLEHRLELVTETNGVKYYNDSFGTTPETAIAAIKSFSEPIILIAGGSEKGSDFANLGEVIVKSNIKSIILIGQMAPRIKSAIAKAGTFEGHLIEGLKTMPEIVTQASKLASPGDVVLLSPACASFDMFKNYKERGNLFKHEVLQLTQKK